MSPRRIVIDVDVGVDDYVALLLFLNADKHNKVRIEAIICSTGNTTRDNVCKNVIRLLELVKRTDIPVYKGAKKQFFPPTHEIYQFHGKDGFADLKHEDEPDLSIIRPEPAAVALGKLILANPKEISLICLATLTNVALAIKLYDHFVSQVKDVWIMGGNYTAVGNVTSCAEYNFYLDAEAASIVLDNITRPIYLLTWEASLLADISHEWRFEVFGKKPYPEIALLNRAERVLYANPEEKWWPCDALLAAAYLDPERFIKRKSLHHASVELHGSQTRGQIVLDHLKKKKTNVTIIEEVDNDEFKQSLLEL